jgi:CRISPR-associated protein Csx10
MDASIRAGGASMNALTFKIELLEPLLVTQLGSGDENSAQSLDYIPGSILRNALAARYIAARNLDDAANDPTCRALFFDDKLRALNSYRADHLGQRSLPTPLSWAAEKEALGNWKSDEKPGDRLSFCDPAVDETVVQGMRDIKTLEGAGKFCRLSEEGVEFVHATRQVNVHIQREHKRELKTKGESQVFVYDALAIGEIFCGAILVQDDAALETFKQMLAETPEFNIGGSRSAGYGRIRIYDVKHDTNWREADENENGEGDIIVTLLSDAIVRDENGQFCDDISPIIGVKPTRCYRKVKQVGGFNRKWGLPLPQAHAIQAGSVFVYAAQDVDKQKLERMVEEGIGERRQDGFGRIAVNWNMQRTLSAQQISPEPKPMTVSLSNDAVSQRLAQRIVEHQLRKQLDQALQREVLKLKIGKGGSKSALARVRLAARRSVFQGNLDPLDDLLAHLKKAGIDNLNKTRVGSDKLYEWLKQRKEKRDVEQQLKVSLDKLPQVGDVRAEFTEKLRNEYTARWIEAVVKRAQKEAQG